MDELAMLVSETACLGAARDEVPLAEDPLLIAYCRELMAGHGVDFFGPDLYAVRKMITAAMLRQHDFEEAAAAESLREFAVQVRSDVRSAIEEWASSASASSAIEEAVRSAIEEWASSASASSAIEEAVRSAIEESANR